MSGTMEATWPRADGRASRHEGKRGDGQDGNGNEAATPRIRIATDGPYLVSGGATLDEAQIVSVEGHHEYRRVRTFDVRETYALCRCGNTTTPPFCDGSHKTHRFDGAEAASRAPYRDRADVYPGAGAYLFDDNRCAYARFCHREDGEAWTLTEESSDPRLKREAVRASMDCPAGRLTHVDTQDARVYEPALAPGITLLQDVDEKVSGPLFVHGRIALEAADGTEYERRSRYALCRCGVSRNKPFCDAMHVNVGFAASLGL